VPLLPIETPMQSKSIDTDSFETYKPLYDPENLLPRS